MELVFCGSSLQSALTAGSKSGNFDGLGTVAEAAAASADGGGYWGVLAGQGRRAG